MYCSIHQAVLIWDELRDAMEGKANFGGDTAEIYAYRLMPNTPSGKHTIEDCLRASSSLVSIIRMFQLEYPDSEFKIDDLTLGSWEELYGASFDHRAHVKYCKK